MTDKPVDNRVQLGCGTLIIIAIIVIVFAGGGESRKLRRQIDEIDRKLDRMERKIDDLAGKLAAPRPAAPAP